MDRDLQSSPPWDGWYEWSLTAFYIAYIAFEWMSLLWKVVPAHIYVALLVLSWGITASLQALATSYPMLIALRTLLGIGEAGFTGIPFYLSFFFKRDELALRTAIFISGRSVPRLALKTREITLLTLLTAAPLATTFASSLAWVILQLGRSSPIAPWRLLFLVEGFPSVLAAVAAWNIIPDSPQTARYLNRQEKRVAWLRLRDTRPRAAPSPSSGPREKEGGGLDARAAFSALADPAVWLTAAMFFLTNMAYSSLPVFLPLILTEMGHDAVSAQALAAPPYLAAFAIVLITARASDAARARAPLLIVHALASAAGYGVLALSGPLGLGAGSIVRYLAVYPAAVGFFNVVVLLIAWNINNQRGESRQGGAFAVFQAVGQCGPLIGTRLYPDVEGPFYARGMLVMACAMLGVAALAAVLRWYLARRNRQLGVAEAANGGGEAGEEEQGLVNSRKGGGGGDGFRYML